MLLTKALEKGTDFTSIFTSVEKEAPRAYATTHILHRARGRAGLPVLPPPAPPPPGLPGLCCIQVPCFLLLRVMGCTPAISPADWLSQASRDSEIYPPSLFSSSPPLHENLVILSAARLDSSVTILGSVDASACGLPAAQGTGEEVCGGVSCWVGPARRR